MMLGRTYIKQAIEARLTKLGTEKSEAKVAESKLASRAKAKDDDLDAAFVLKTQQQMLEMRQGYERLKRQVRSHCRYLFLFSFTLK